MADDYTDALWKSGTGEPRPEATPEAAARILAAAPSSYSLKLLRDWFAARADRGPMVDPRAAIVVPQAFRGVVAGPFEDGDWPARAARNWADVRETTAGRYAANCLIFSRTKKLRDAFPYYNEPWDSGVIGRIQGTVCDSLLDGRIDAEDAAWVIDRMQWLGYAPTSFLAPSMTADTLRMPPEAKELKAQIMSGPRGDAVRSGDLQEVAAVEKDLLARSREGLAHDPGMEIYASGARGSFGNNYKNTAVMRGAMRKSDDPSDIKVSAASLEEGIPASEIPQYADLLVQASYGRAMMTRVGGYIQKQMNAAFQGLQLDPDPQSDCGTRMLLPVQLDEPNEYMYRFFADAPSPGGLQEITPATASSMKGRFVQMRSPLFCGTRGAICSRCAGTLYYRMGILNVGLLAGRVGTVIMNSSLKAFHDTTLKTTRIDLGSYTRERPPPKKRVSIDIEEEPPEEPEPELQVPDPAL